MRLSSVSKGLTARHILLSLLIFLPILLGLFFMWHQQEEVLREKARADMLRVTRSTTFEVEHLLRDARQLLVVLGQVPQLNNPDKKPLIAVFKQLMNSYPRYSSLIQCAPDGTVLCSVPATESGKSLGHRGYFRKAVATGQIVGSDFLIGHLTGLPVLVLANPIRGDSGEVESVLVAGINLNWVSKFLDTGLLSDFMTFYAVDSEGNILLRHPAPENIVGTSIESLVPFFDEIVDDQGASFQVHERGKEGLLVAHAPMDLSYSRVHFLTVMPHEMAYASIRRAFKTNLLLVVGMLAATLCIAWIGGHRLVGRQVRSLVDATRRVTDGNLEVRSHLADSGGGELRQLGTSFNLMTKTLAEREKSLLAQQRDIVRLNRVHAVLSGINGTIVRTRDRAELLREACRIGVHHGGFHLVWIGFIDPDTRRVLPTAYDGQALCQLENQEVSPEQEIEFGCRPWNRQVLEGTPLVCNDLQGREDFGHCLERPLFADCQSLASLPLKVDDKVIGILSFFGSEKNLFDAEEIDLLEELAADVSLGLEHIDKERRLSYLAFYDLVTGLPNRDLFLDRLSKEIERAGEEGKRGAVVALRIGRLEEMRDLHGQSHVDQLLRDIGRQISETVQRGETVGKIGADEFGILLSVIDGEDSIPTATDRIFQAVSEVPALRQKNVFLNLLMGVTIFPQDGKSPEGLLKNAQVAMHYPQERDAPYHFYCHEIDDDLIHRHRIEGALHAGLRDGEFTAHYQPIIDMQEGRIIAAEALLRWRSRELGQVSPGEFIPVAEATGLIQPLGRWVLREVFTQARRWREQGLPEIKLAANISTQQIHQQDFISGIESLLAETGVDPRQIRLALEVTESGLMENLETSLEKLHRLRELGFELYIDDFGTGYSSLSYLKQLPFNKLKIDRSFVCNVLDDEQDRILCRSIIALAHQLGMRVLAEGIETEEQLTMLREFGCDSYQGYLYSPPVPAEKFQEFFS